MYEGLFSNVKAPFGQFFAPAQKFNSLVLENAGKVAEFQINAAQSYTDIGLKQFRDALQVRGAEDFQQLMTSQGETNRALTAKLLTDTQALFNLGQDFGKDVQKLLMEDVIEPIIPTAKTSASRKPA